MPALSAPLDLLPSIEFAQKQTLVPELDRLNKLLIAQQTEFWGEVAKPKASRRLALGKEYLDSTLALLATLDKTSAALAASVNSRGCGVRPVAGHQADRVAVAQHGRRSLGDGLERAQHRKTVAGTEPLLHAFRRRHRRDLERAAADGGRHAIAAGALRRHGRDQDRLFRSRLSRAARRPGDPARRRRETRHDRQPMEPDHGRALGRGGQGRRGRAGCGRGALGRTAFRGPALAGAATRTARWPRSP